MVIWTYFIHGCEGDLEEVTFYYMELKYEKTMLSNSKCTQIWQPKNSYLDSRLWMPCHMPFETLYKMKQMKKEQIKTKKWKKKILILIFFNCIKSLY